MSPNSAEKLEHPRNMSPDSTAKLALLENTRDRKIANLKGIEGLLQAVLQERRDTEARAIQDLNDWRTDLDADGLALIQYLFTGQTTSAGVSIDSDKGTIGEDPNCNHVMEAALGHASRILNPEMFRFIGQARQIHSLDSRIVAFRVKINGKEAKIAACKSEIARLRRQS